MPLSGWLPEICGNTTSRCAVLSDSTYNFTTGRAHRTLPSQELGITGLKFVCGKYPHQRSANHSTCTKSRQISVLCDLYMFAFFKEMRGEKGGRKEKGGGRK